MTRITFGVSASSFAANMAVKQNAIDYSHEFPMAAEVVQKSFYVDDCLTGAIESKSALLLQQQLTALLSRGGFVLRNEILMTPLSWKKSLHTLEILVKYRLSLMPVSIRKHLVLNGMLTLINSVSTFLALLQSLR